MSERQWKRWDVVGRVSQGRLAVGEAARICGLSIRQMRRLRSEVAARGQAALIHGNQGRAPANRTDDATRARIVALRRGKYEGFNDRHLTEKLAGETPPVGVSVWTVRRVLRSGGIGCIGGAGSAERRLG